MMASLSYPGPRKAGVERNNDKLSVTNIQFFSPSPSLRHLRGANNEENYIFSAFTRSNAVVLTNRNRALCVHFALVFLRRLFNTTPSVLYITTPSNLRTITPSVSCAKTPSSYGTTTPSRFRRTFLPLPLSLRAHNQASPFYMRLFGLPGRRLFTV